MFCRQSDDGFDFDFNSRDGKRADLDERARRPNGAEEPLPDRIDLLSVSDVGQVNRNLQHVGKCRAGSVQDFLMLSSTCGVCAAASSPPISRPFSSSGMTPETNSKSPKRTASV